MNDAKDALEKSVTKYLGDAKAQVGKLLEMQPENLRERIVSAAILIPAALLCVWFGGLLYNLLIIVAAILMSFEWTKMTAGVKDEREQKLWMVRGLLYVAIPCACMLWLRQLDVEEDGTGGGLVVTWLLATVWATDVAAYFVGKQFGKRPLAEKISPNKTIEGLLGGVAAAALVGVLLAGFLGGFWKFLLLSILVAFVAQGGDLLQSWMKRSFKLKDSGDIIPGHGGIMDRIDGLVTAAPFITFIMVFMR